MNPIVRFIYWNMNYHVEHHMFPLVPYHALPALHEELKADMPPALPGVRRDLSRDHPGADPASETPADYVRRPLPGSAAAGTAELTPASATA